MTTGISEFPQTLPPRTVVGNIRSVAGIAEAIPIATLSSELADASTILFTQSGTGAVARTVQNKERDIVSVKDFGAVGDGATNDTAAIQAAVTAAAGRMVLFPAGTYVVTASISYTTTGAYVPGLNITGEGMTSIIDNRVAGGAAFVSKSTQAGNFQLGGGVRNLKIITTTSPATSHGIEMQAAYNFVVENVWIKGMSGDGYRITCLLGDSDAAIGPVVRNCRFENCDIGINSNSANTVTQVSFLQCYGNLFVSCVTAGCRYIGANGTFIGNGFATCTGPGLWMVFNNANNPQFNAMGNTFENNGGVGVPQLRIDSALAATFIDTEIASTVGNCTVGVYVVQSGGGSALNVVFDGTYVRVGAGFNPYTAFTLGANAVFAQIRNTHWNTFDAAGQVRYVNSGSSNRLSDSSSRLVQGNGASGANITLVNGANQNVALPVEGTVFLPSGPSAGFNIGGFTAPLDNREIIISNATGQVMTLNNEDAGSTAANRLRMDNGVNVVVNTSGAARLAYINGRWQVIGKG